MSCYSSSGTDLKDNWTNSLSYRREKHHCIFKITPHNEDGEEQCTRVIIAHRIKVKKTH